MTTADWSHVEPSVEPSTDLFDGDLLGDELIDIYNAAVVGGGEDDDMNEIPSLLAPTPDSSKKHHSDYMHDAVPSQDDGLGAFRPSTSFNDLSTLLPPEDAQATSSHLPPVVTSNSLSQLAPDTKNGAKRAIDGAHSDMPAAKRRPSSAKKSIVSVPAAKGKSKVPAAVTTSLQRPAYKSKAQSAARAKSEKKNDTPNPLTSGKPQPPTLAAKGNIMKNTATVPGAVPATVVTPRLPVASKGVDAKKGSSPPAVITTTPTEADFKSVAQAAVSNLILNAGTLSKNDSPTTAISKEAASNVNTSTEHIKALTGSNWVTVCSGGDSTSGSSANADKMNNRARRQNLTPDERARQNRDRNREHARNTRLRKKAYVEELKRTLTALVSQRDAAELEKRHTVQRELEQREVRFRVIEEFLKLRGRNEANLARWAAILEENFTFTLPLTDFRSMVPTPSSSSPNRFEQVLTGVSEVMADSNLLASFIQGLSKQNGKENLSFVYSCDRKNFFMDNCYAVLDWTASTNGAVANGALSELTIKGNLKAKFSPASNKLVSVVMTYDTGVFVSQVNRILEDAHACNDDVAAQVAASEADAILDSLQMPNMPTSVPVDVTVLPSNSPASITDVEKEDSSDESNGDADENLRAAVNA